MGGCTTTMEQPIHDSSSEGHKLRTLGQIETASLPPLSDTELMLGPKIKEDELEQAVDRIFEKFDLDKD